MGSILIKNSTIINEGRRFHSDLLISGEEIVKIGNSDFMQIPSGARVIDAKGLFLIPGVIDDHVHFREPGLTDKAEIFTETSAAAAGGVTSFMDMPNTIPPATSLEALNEKYKLGAEKSLINYSFYIGATNDNLSEIMNTDPNEVCGIKLFMGPSTGNMLVDDEKALKELFSRALMPVAAHCEDAGIIKKNSDTYRQKYGEDVPARMHALIRNREACFMSSSYAVNLAREYNTRLHILHISTADELRLFSRDIPLAEKRITAEACVHHLWFEESSYDELGNLVKWNPSIKTRFDRDALRNALNNNLIDVIGTDHAPHRLEDKQKSYFLAPSGGPFIQHSLVAMFELWHRKVLEPERIVELMCHNPSILFNIEKRGFIREGYKADICLIDPDQYWTLTNDSLLYKCKWSPLTGTTFSSKVIMTIVNGNMVFEDGTVNTDHRGHRLLFGR